MPQVNQCNFIGNVGGAPTVKTFPDGGKIASVNIAVTERWKGRDGQPAERTEWVPLLFDGPLAEVAEKYIEKGATLYVSAKFSQRKYTNAEGVKKQLVEFRVRELQLLSGRKEDSAQAAAAAGPATTEKLAALKTAAAPAGSSVNRCNTNPELDPDLPF